MSVQSSAFVRQLLLQDRQCAADFQEQCNPEEAYYQARIKKSTTSKRFADAANATHTAANHTAAAAAAPAAAHGKRRLAAAASELAVDEAHAVCDGAFLVSAAAAVLRPWSA
jgi:hypothetical protein